MALNNVFEFRVGLLDTRSTINRLGRLDLIFAVVSFALLITWHRWFQHNNSSKTIYSPNPRVIQTLSAFITPTSCASISNHAFLLKDTKCLKSCLIELDLSELIDSICTGKVELRDSSDLHDLFRAKLRIYGWHFDILMDRNWSFRILRWIIAHHVCIFFRSSAIPIQPLAAVDTGVALHHSATFYPLDLDFVPFHKLEKEISKIQSSLQSGSTIILEFSCLAPEVKFMGRDFILCAIPFLLRTYKDSKEALNYRRTTTALLTRFNTFVAHLSLESSTIKSIGNISRWHAYSLLQFEERLSNDRHLRMTCIQEEGIVRWREKKIMLAWEAGLLRAGLLTRWQVVLVK